MFQRFVDELRSQYEAATMDVESVNYFGIPDEDNKYRLEFTFGQNHPSAEAMTDFIHDVSDRMPGAFSYRVTSVRRQKNDEYVFIVKVEQPSI